MAQGTHDHQIDPRNENIKININGELFRREDAKVSVFDSGYILGDGIWEGLRFHKGKVLFAREHMRRLYEGAKALDMEMDVGPEAMLERIYETCRANDMETGVHIRLMVTRGVKSTPYRTRA